MISNCVISVITNSQFIHSCQRPDHPVRICFMLMTSWMHIMSIYIYVPPSCITRETHTCCAPLSLLRVRSSSEWEAQISCRAARSRDKSVLKCSVDSGRSGTFWRNSRENVIGKLLHTELINWAAGNPCCFKNGYRAVYPQLIQKHDHPLFVVLDERIHPLHVGLLQHKHITTNASQH